MPCTHSRSPAVLLNTGGVSASSTVMVNVNVSVSLAAVLASASVTVYVYVVAPCVAVGVPHRIRVVALNATPAGGAGDSEYVNSPLPPVASGNVTGEIAVPCSHSRSSAVSPPNDGAVSGGATAIVKVNVSVSLAAVLASASVTVYVYSVASCVAVGVPDRIRVVALNATPAGGEGDSE